MTNNTPSGAKKRREYTELESCQTAKMFSTECNYYARVGAQVLYKQNDPYTIRVNLKYAGSSVLREI